MAGAEKMVEKVPGWVERLLIPTLETRVRAVVQEEVGHLEKTLNARFDTLNVKFDGVNSRIDSLERRIPIMQDIADLKSRLAVIEKRTTG